MPGVSENYRELSPEEVDAVAVECAQAWRDDSIPKLQYELAVRNELEILSAGVACAPFAALFRCLKRIPESFLKNKPSLLDVGASSGYYKRAMELGGFQFNYCGFDFSEAFKRLAIELYPNIWFDVGDARSLPYSDDNFSVVLHGACIMHISDFRSAIKEAARVASHYVIFHRTSITEGPTRFWRKEAYGVPCLEIHFNQEQLISEFNEAGLVVVGTEIVFQQEGFAHKTFLCVKLNRRSAAEPNRV